MKMLSFSSRTAKEILRDPLNIVFISRGAFAVALGNTGEHTRQSV